MTSHINPNILLIGGIHTFNRQAFIFSMVRLVEVIVLLIIGGTSERS